MANVVVENRVTRRRYRRQAHSDSHLQVSVITTQAFWKGLSYGTARLQRKEHCNLRDKHLQLSIQN